MKSESEEGEEESPIPPIFLIDGFAPLHNSKNKINIDVYTKSNLFLSHTKSVYILRKADLLDNQKKLIKKLSSYLM